MAQKQIECSECGKSFVVDTSWTSFQCPHCEAKLSMDVPVATPLNETPPSSQQGSNRATNALVGAMIGVFLGFILILAGCDISLSHADSDELTLVFLFASPFGIIGAIIGLATGK